MKILTVVHDFRGGGAEKVAVLLANEWQAQGYFSEIVCICEAGPFRSLVDASVPVICLGRSHAYEAIPALASLLRSRQDSVVVAHLSHINVMSILAGLIAGHRHVFVVEHSDFRRARNDRPSTAAAIGFAIAPFVYARAEKVICVSQSVCDSIPFLPGGRVRRGCVIANPISSEEFADTDSEVNPHPWFAERVPVLVACGRFTPAKNYEMMLYAFASIMTRIPARLIILGEGPERDKIINLATALSVSRNVTFAGFQQKPGRYFAKARLFISSSAWEGLPMTMIEALFSGANMVVTHSCSDAPHLVNRGLFGSCVDSWSADCFADAIIKELDRPVASLAAKREFLSKYSLPKIAAEYGALFASAYSAVNKKQS